MDSGAIENCVYLRCHGQPTLWLGVAWRPLSPSRRRALFSHVISDGPDWAAYDRLCQYNQLHWLTSDWCLSECFYVGLSGECLAQVERVASLAPGGKQNWSGLRYFDVDSMFNISTQRWFDAPIVMLSSYFVTSDYNEIWTQMYSQVTEVNHQYEYYTWWLFDF